MESIRCKEDVHENREEKEMDFMQFLLILAPA